MELYVNENVTMSPNLTEDFGWFIEEISAGGEEVCLLIPMCITFITTGPYKTILPYITLQRYSQQFE